MTRGWMAWSVVALSVATGAIGCGDDDDDTAVLPGDMAVDTSAVPDMARVDMTTEVDPEAEARSIAADDRTLAANCMCDPAPFADVATCRSNNEISSEISACRTETYAANFNAAGTAASCLANASEARADCFEGAGCDDDTLQGCQDAYEAATGGCPVLPSTFADAVLACINMRIVGAASDCPEGSPSSDVGSSVFSGNTTLAGDDFLPSCVEENEGGGSPDRAFEYTAPAAGNFAFDTDGSAFDTGLAIFDGCAGAELACNDDSGSVSALRSRVIVTLEAGQTVVVVVDGYSVSNYGDFQVNVTMIEPIDPDANALTRNRSAETRLRSAGCMCDFEPFASAGECTRFEPDPAALLSCQDTAYTDNFAAAGEAVTCNAIAFEDYATCVENAACDEDAIDACDSAITGALTDCAARPEAFLDALDSCVAQQLVGTTPSMCPAQAASSATGASVFSGTTVAMGDDIELACTSGGSPDVVYEWVAPSAGTFAFDTAGSNFDTAIALFDACDGNETQCNDDAEADDLGLLSRVTETVTMGQSVFVVVEGFGETNAGDFVININPM